MRGLVNTEANIRGTGALALLLKSQDLLTGRRSYTRRSEYHDMAKWIDSMRDVDGGYYEFQKASDGKRRGKGSAGQAIPCFWIFGTL